MKKLTKTIISNYFIMGTLILSAFFCLVTSITAMRLVLEDQSDLSAEAINDIDRGRESFAAYLRENDRKEAFLLISMSSLIIVVFLLLIILLVQIYLGMIDKKKISLWKENGIIYERIEILPEGRLRIDNIEIEINKAQMQTLLDLVKHRINGTPLHTANMQTDNGAQMIKRLREEIGCKIIEKTLIKNHRGKGYWFDVKPENIKIKLPNQ